MAYRFEVSANEYVVRIYDEEAHSNDNYISSAMIRCYGDRGWMSCITGAGFYTCIKAKKNLEHLMKHCGVVTLEGYVTDAHARIMRAELRHVATVDISHRGKCAGRDMPWVIVRIRSPEPALPEYEIGP